MTLFRRIAGLLLLLGVVATLAACSGVKPGNAKAFQPLKEATVSKIKAVGSTPGSGLLVRIFKESSELEVWKETATGYKLLKTYALCAWSGVLGPKIKEGDRQAPEGFYSVGPGQMNPNSIAYLSFNTGYPNKFDRAHGRTGTDLMVHGDCSSRGCYAVTNEDISEIYALARESFAGGTPTFQVQIYPFRMTPQNMARQSKSEHFAFWKNLKEGYDRFEVTRMPVNWDVCNKQYVFDVPSGTGVLNATAACPAGVGQTAMTAALQQKQAADDAAMQVEVANLEKKAAEDARRAEADRLAAEKAVAAAAEGKARGEAIGNWVGGLLGGGKDAGVEKTIDPTKKAPVPNQRPQRS